MKGSARAGEFGDLKESAGVLFFAAQGGGGGTCSRDFRGGSESGRGLSDWPSVHCPALKETSFRTKRPEKRAIESER